MFVLYNGGTEGVTLGFAKRLAGREAARCGAGGQAMRIMILVGPDHPVNFETWYDTIRFANWLNNGQDSGDTETGAYTLGTLGAGGIPVTPPPHT